MIDPHSKQCFCMVCDDDDTQVSGFCVRDDNAVTAHPFAVGHPTPVQVVRVMWGDR